MKVLFLVVFTIWTANHPSEKDVVCKTLQEAEITVDMAYDGDNNIHFQIYEVNLTSGTVEFVKGCK